jgi:anionic cell wall polymer biosynthesis LytR-Cps2A-Psr (LCP) family protein
MWRDSFNRQEHDQKADTAATQHDSSCLKGQTRSMYSHNKTSAGPDTSFMLRRWISTNVNEEPWTAETRQKRFLLGQQYKFSS